MFAMIILRSGSTDVIAWWSRLQQKVDDARLQVRHLTPAGNAVPPRLAQASSARWRRCTSGLGVAVRDVRVEDR
ncbi:hypothetical protein AAFM48_12465 [Burkholderia pseudomallei]